MGKNSCTGISKVVQFSKVTEFPKTKKQYGAICEEEPRTLDSAQLFYKGMNVVFEKILTDIETMIENIKNLRGIPDFGFFKSLIKHLNTNFL